MAMLLQNKKGSALIMVLLITIVLFTLGSAILGVAASEYRFAKRQEDKMKAYYIARSGAQAIADYMMRDANNDAKTLVNKESEWNSQVGGGRFKVKVYEDSEKNVYITSTGEYNGIQQQVHIRMTSSSKGVGNIFDYAIAAIKDIKTQGSSNGSEIHGSIASKTGVIYLDTDKNKCKVIGSKIIDNNLIFPAIVEPENYYTTFDKVNTVLEKEGNKDKYVKILPSNSTQPTYILHNGDLILKNNLDKIRVTQGNIVHLYVKGDKVELHNIEIEIENNAQLYIYVINQSNNGNVSIKLNGGANNLFIYAPTSLIEYHNAKAADMLGAIYGYEVILHNFITIKYNPDVKNHIDLDTSNAGISFDGYVFID